MRGEFPYNKTVYATLYVKFVYIMRTIFVVLLMLSAAVRLQAQQEQDEESKYSLKPLNDITYGVEMQGSVSHGNTPLWLNANKYGLSSLKETNGYLRMSAIRPLDTDAGRHWGLGYGVDVALPVNYTSHVIVQQAYVEGRWLHGSLSIGAKEYPMELKNNQLSSGSQTLGKNARPVPQVRLALPEYWTLPFANGWLHLKGHIAYGKMTDDNWQHDFTQKQSKYADDVLYHSKAGYLMIGNADVFCPWSLELGLEMACEFGGTSYSMRDGVMVATKNATGLKSFLKAFIPGGSDTPEQGTVYQNEEGNQLGSWLARVNYDADDWRFSVYADKFFEDHSAMFQLDYDGYGTGDNWNVREKRRYFLYDFKDWMLGAEFSMKYDRAVNTILFEYIYSKYQSGPIYHDHSAGRPDSHISGIDNFYNHYIYPGWQHWGQVMGNPLYRSPIYNTDGSIKVEDNRFMAFHLGIDGWPMENFYYRVLGTWQEGLGTYAAPYTQKHHNVSFLLEGQYDFWGTQHKWLKGCSVKVGYGMDFGAILNGPNYGLQLTLMKKGIFNL